MISLSKRVASGTVLFALMLSVASSALGEVEIERVDDKDARIAALENQLRDTKAELAKLRETRAPGEEDQVAEEKQEDRVSGVASVTFLNERNARGMVLEDQGLITQGLLGVNFEVADGVTVITGMWTDIHSNSDGPGPSAAGAGAGTAGTNLDEFYEFDWWVGASIELGKINFTAYYEEFLNPADDFVAATGGFESRHIQTVVSYDGLGDDLIEGVKLNPYIRSLFELDGSVGPTASDGVYIELGIVPSFLLIDRPEYPVTAAFPLIVGLGTGNFYENNEEIGYVSIGAEASMPIECLSDWGAWTLTTGIKGVFGNDDAVGTFNSTVAGQSNDTRVIGFISFGLGF